MTTMDSGLLLEMYRKMMTIRLFDARAVEEFHAGNIPGVVHAYIGEEAVAVGVCSALRTTDRIASTHRGHGHTIAKGADINLMMAELFGRSNGYCHGKGGSMHIADFSVGMLGGQRHRGRGDAHRPPARALAAKLEGGDGVAVAFFGDGASNEGAFHGSLNLASIWNLPVIYVCENNRWASGNSAAGPPSRWRKSLGKGRRLQHARRDRGTAPTFLAVYEAAQAAVQRAREGGGPTLLECKTFPLGAPTPSPAETRLTRGQPARSSLASPTTRWRVSSAAS